MYFDPVEAGKRIAKQRRLMGLTQEEFAEQLHISCSHYGKIETGYNGVSIDLMTEIAEKLNASLDYLVLGKRREREILRHKVRSMIEFLMAIEKEI